MHWVDWLCLCCIPSFTKKSLLRFITEYGLLLSLANLSYSSNGWFWIASFYCCYWWKHYKVAVTLQLLDKIMFCFSTFIQLWTLLINTYDKHKIILKEYQKGKKIHLCTPLTRAHSLKCRDSSLRIKFQNKISFLKFQIKSNL